MNDSMLRLLDEMLAVAPDDLVPLIGRLRREVLAGNGEKAPKVRPLSVPGDVALIDPAPSPSAGLRPMRPVDGEVKRLRAIDVPCPSCKAKPGAGCMRMRTNGSTTADPLPKGKLHQSRRDRAKDKNNGG